VFDPAGRREMLLKFLLCLRRNRDVVAKYDGAGRGCALINGKDMGRHVVSSNTFRFNH
jgi:hypothetical protein